MFSSSVTFFLAIQIQPGKLVDLKTVALLQREY